jgi:hypothetical protein
VTDPGDFFTKAAAVAREKAAEAAAVLSQASDKMDLDRDHKAGDPVNYTAGDLVGTMASLAKIAVQGSRVMAERVRGAAVPPTAADQPVSAVAGAALVADYVSTVFERTLDQYGEILETATADVEKNGYRPEQFMPALTKLIDVTVVNGIEVVQTVVAGPAPYARIKYRSDPISAGDPQSADHTLSIAEPFTRPGTSDVIGNERIIFDPPVLEKDGETTFTIVVHEENKPSGVYLGKVNIGADREPLEVALRL